MSADDSVTQWLTRLKAGQKSALQELHFRYWPVVVSLARKKLRGKRSADADEEDVAQEALLNLFEGIEGDRFPQLNNRQDLLALLTVITVRRAIRQLERGGRQKRGAGRVVHASALETLSQSSQGLDGFKGPERLSPLETIVLTETYEHFVKALPVDLRAYAELYLSGHTCEEIAIRMGCVKRTVERKIQRVRQIWALLSSTDDAET